MERTFDWAPHHDPRSREFPVRTALPARRLRRRLTRRSSIRWWASHHVLDQGAEGACVGFGWTQEAMAMPVRIHPDDPHEFARSVYSEAQFIDEWPGEAYEGTSVLAGAKIMQRHGYIDGYRWAFSIDDVIDALLYLGPVVIGIPWYESMYETRPSGLVEVGGRLVGGHCIVLVGYQSSTWLPGESIRERHEVFRWRNSWGKSYGKRGDGFVRRADLERLLADQGEACVPMGRSRLQRQPVAS
jgi:hypothetical protein